MHKTWQRALQVRWSGGGLCTVSLLHYWGSVVISLILLYTITSISITLRYTNLSTHQRKMGDGKKMTQLLDHTISKEEKRQTLPGGWQLRAPLVLSPGVSPGSFSSLLTPPSPSCISRTTDHRRIYNSKPHLHLHKFWLNWSLSPPPTKAFSMKMDLQYNCSPPVTCKSVSAKPQGNSGRKHIFSF